MKDKRLKPYMFMFGLSLLQTMLIIFVIAVILSIVVSIWLT
ncbi:MAG: hypothetical protein ACD_44C00221G0006 [uncultured bacterium]|nr:MAG: hypothetical protein ACD_44C00221G0006 [uncultured bacterium]